MDEEIEVKVDIPEEKHIDMNVEESLGFGLIHDAEKLNELTREEADLLREKYRKVFEAFDHTKSQDQFLSRKMKVLRSDILAEKITLEKLRMEETDETKRVQNSSELRNKLQQELEEVEQKETMVKFELFELKRVHEELQIALTNMKKQNHQLVEPVLEKLRKEIVDLTEELKTTEETYERETNQKIMIEQKVQEMKALFDEKSKSLNERNEEFHILEMEPGRFQRQIQSFESACKEIKGDYDSILKKIEANELELKSKARKKLENEKLRQSILEKLELNRQTLEEREREVSLLSSNIEKNKSINHELITKKVELNVLKRELDSQFRHITDQVAIAGKDYDNLKRTIKKKRIILDLSKQNIPTLENQLKDAQLLLQNTTNEKVALKKELDKYKEEADYHIARLLQQEGLEHEKKKELEKAISEVDEMEARVVQELAEGKRQSKLKAVLSAQRDIKARENVRIEQKENEAKQQVKMKELVILDLTKRCNEITNRLKEFSALYEVVKNERNKYVNLIQSSAQALAEMREKIRILQNEVEILGNERAAKDMALTKERNAHVQAQNQRDVLRQDLNRLLSEYRSKQSMVEQQIQEIDKLNVVINNLEKEMLQIKSRYEKAVEERNLTGVQLIDRNDELCILYERSNQQQDTLKRGEMALIKQVEEIRLLTLYNQELKRKYLVAKHRIPEITKMKVRVDELKIELDKEQKYTQELSTKLEDPDNLERWRPLKGEDMDIEQIESKLKILEHRLDQKRETLLEKELVLEEITTLTEKLRGQALSKRDKAKLLSDQLNELHTKIRDVTKKMLASVSELSMYQATALRLQQEKIEREKALEEAQWRIERGEAPTHDAEVTLRRNERTSLMRQEFAERKAMELPMQSAAPGTLLRTAAEPRPTAYIPDEVGIPKPYGNFAPFKPSDQGSSMRHIKPPQIKPIEI